MSKKVIVIGGGIAGMQTAVTLSELGLQTTIIEKNEVLGGKLNSWYKLFPTLTPAYEVVEELERQLNATSTQVVLNTRVESIDHQGVIVDDGKRIYADAVVICVGFDVFDARIKEEYGYGIYKNVFTSVDIERMFNKGDIELTNNRAPQKIAFLHCVGSRDEKVCQRHCSRVCCITAVKQAIELKEMFPESEIYNFYMDIRMFGPGYEEMYRQAQEQFNIHFVRGRISEASQTIDSRIQIKAEDTLVGRPLKMTVDMLVLAVGMVSAKSNEQFAENKAIDLYESGFIRPKDQFTGNVSSGGKNIFYAGTVTAPKNVGESINEGIAAAYKVSQYLSTPK